MVFLFVLFSFFLRNTRQRIRIQMTTTEPSTTSKPPTKHDVEVNWEDQQRICAFGRLNNRTHELRAMIASREV